MMKEHTYLHDIKFPLPYLNLINTFTVCTGRRFIGKSERVFFVSLVIGSISPGLA